jgi:hypothetical protein
MRKKYAASAAQAELEEKMEEEKVKEWKRKYHEIKDDHQERKQRGEVVSSSDEDEDLDLDFLYSLVEGIKGQVSPGSCNHSALCCK